MKSNITLFLFLLLFLPTVLCSCHSGKKSQASKDDKDSSYSTDALQKAQKAAQLSAELQAAKADSIKSSQSHLKKDSTHSIVKLSFQISRATAQNWNGGVRGSGGGTHYRFYIYPASRASQFIFDQIWIDGNFFVPTVLSSQHAPGEHPIESDSLVLKVDQRKPGESFDHHVNTPDTVSSPNVPIPEHYKGRIILGYMDNGIRKYISSDKIEQLPTLNYP